jgi:hypothetical protein
VKLNVSIGELIAGRIKELRRCLEDGKLKFSFKKPYDVLLQPEVKEDVQPWIEAIRTFYIQS